MSMDKIVEGIVDGKIAVTKVGEDIITCTLKTTGNVAYFVNKQPQNIDGEVVIELQQYPVEQTDEKRLSETLEKIAGDDKWFLRSLQTITWREYQIESSKTAVFDENIALMYCLTKLSGESGELLNIMGKPLRGEIIPFYTEKVISELGDILWYATQIMTRFEQTFPFNAMGEYLNLENPFLKGKGYSHTGSLWAAGDTLNKPYDEAMSLAWYILECASNALKMFRQYDESNIPNIQRFGIRQTMFSIISAVCVLGDVIGCTPNDIGTKNLEKLESRVKNNTLTNTTARNEQF